MNRANHLFNKARLKVLSARPFVSLSRIRRAVQPTCSLVSWSVKSAACKARTLWWRTSREGVDIGTEPVSRAAPNGNTLLITSDVLVITQHVRPSLTFDPLTSFEPICSPVTVPMAVAVNSASPYRKADSAIATRVGVRSGALEL
jgi:hypothetical protein